MRMLVRNVMLGLTLFVMGFSTVVEAKSPGEVSTIYIHLNFEGNNEFPSITSQNNTFSLDRFTGTEFNLPTEQRDALVATIVDRVAQDYQDFSNVVILTNNAGLDWWYEWGIDDSAYVYDKGVSPCYEPNLAILPIDPHSSCPDGTNGACKRLYGKAGSYPDVDQVDAWGGKIFNPMHARTFAGSFALDTGDADLSEPTLYWGESLTGTGKHVDLETLGNALGNSAAHEIAHLFGATHKTSGLMSVETEKREAFRNKSFGTSTMELLNKVIVQASTADQFEPNESGLSAGEMTTGNYPNLTLDNPFDEDFYNISNDENDGEINISLTVDRRQFASANYTDSCTPLPEINNFISLLIEYRDCDGCPGVLVGPEVTDTGYKYKELGVPAGRTYLLHIFQIVPRQPVNYGLEVYAGRGDLSPDINDVDVDTDFNGNVDQFNDNDSQMTATEWTDPCDYTNTLSIDNAADIDYYKLGAAGYSLQAELTYETSRGDLQLFLDDIQATELTPSTDGASVTFRISGCGQSTSYVKVQGEPNYYSLCVKKISLQETCPDYKPWTPFAGGGNFTYQVQPPFQPLVEVTGEVREQIFARLFEESDESVTWTLAGWVDYGSGLSQPVEGRLIIQRPSGTPVFTAHILDVSNLREWYQIEGQCTAGNVSALNCLENSHCDTSFGAGDGICTPVNVGSATVEGLDTAITSFDVSSGTDGMFWTVTRPSERGTLVIHGALDTDSDGIPDETEIATGTDPNSDDTDGDGLPDGVEDANRNGIVDPATGTGSGNDETGDPGNDFVPGETDPRLWDSDGDGVSDGVESGLTSGEGNDTDPGLFRADEDPSTTTDPTRADTDGDGMSDGEEDANQNGRLDPGETSPLVRDVFGAQADLIVESLTHSPANPTTVDNITFTAVVKNAGNAQASVSIFSFRIGGEAFGQDFAIPALNPGDSFMVQRQIVLGVAQNYRNNVTADSNDEVTESDENNNQGADDYTVTQGGDLDGDGDVDLDDVNELRAALGTQEGDPNYNPAADLDRDGRVTVNDYRILRSQL